MASHVRVWMIAAVLLCAAGSAVAQDTGATAGLFDRDSLTGGWFGAAADLKEHGVGLGATEISEVLGVLSGGSRGGVVYEGRLELDLDIDLGELIGLNNTVFHTHAFQIHGRGLSGNYLGSNFETVSNIEATRAARLFDIWVEHGFLDNALSVRLGQIAADDEFYTSLNTGGLMNATFGFPAVLATALPSGGAEYPLATPGIRVKYAFTNAITVQLGVFNGDPAGGDPGISLGAVDPQTSNPDGTQFAIDHSPLVILEASYAVDADTETSPTDVYKIGVWRQGGRYDDVAVDSAGRSLALPGTQTPRPHAGDFGIYFVADALVYKVADDRSVNGFLRMGTAPTDRNFIGFDIDGGFAFKGPIASRPDDIASLGASFAQVSGRVADLFAAFQRYAGSTTPAPDYEAVIELNYQIGLAPWWTLQPDLQYVFHPTSQLLQPNPAVTPPYIHNALIAGVRTSIRF